MRAPPRILVLLLAVLCTEPVISQPAGAGTTAKVALLEAEVGKLKTEVEQEAQQKGLRALQHKVQDVAKSISQVTSEDAPQGRGRGRPLIPLGLLAAQAAAKGEIEETENSMGDDTFLVAWACAASAFIMIAAADLMTLELQNHESPEKVGAEGKLTIRSLVAMGHCVAAIGLMCAASGPDVYGLCANLLAVIFAHLAARIVFQNAAREPEKDPEWSKRPAKWIY